MTQAPPDSATVERVARYAATAFPFVGLRPWRRLKELFPRPRGRALEKFWSGPSHADLALFLGKKLVAILEPGGIQHAVDPDQQRRDATKDAICRQFGVSVVRFYNSEIERMDSKAWRKLLRAAIFLGLRNSRVTDFQEAS